MNKNRFKELLRSTMGDVRPLVSEHVLREAKDDETQYHRYQEGGDPGIEPFLENPMNEMIADELQHQLENDKYAKGPEFLRNTNLGKGTGKLFIFFNGQKMTPSQFIDQIQEDASEGFCHTINSYEYNNRVLASTKITISTKTGECKKSTPIKDEDPIKFDGSKEEITIRPSPNLNDVKDPEDKTKSPYILGKIIKISPNGPRDHGARPLGNWQSDNATDIFGAPGTVVYSITKGVVSKIGGDQNNHKGKIYGAQITIKGDGGYTNVFYTHLQNVMVNVGQEVKLGTPLGEISLWETYPRSSHVHVGLESGGLNDLVDLNNGKIK